MTKTYEIWLVANGKAEKVKTTQSRLWARRKVSDGNAQLAVMGIDAHYRVLVREGTRVLA